MDTKAALRTRQIGLRLTPEEHTYLEAMAQRTGHSMSYILRLLLRQAEVVTTTDIRVQDSGALAMLAAGGGLSADHGRG